MRYEKVGKWQSKEEINEVEELRFLFSKFFQQSNTLNSNIQLTKVKDRSMTVLK